MMSHLNLSADEPTARAHSGRRRSVSFGDATSPRLSAQPMPAAMPGRTNRRRSSVSWDTMIDVRIIPARAFAQVQALKEVKRSGISEDVTCSRLAAPPMPATSPRPRRHSSVSLSTMIDVLPFPVRTCAQDDCEQPLKEAKRSSSFEDATCSRLAAPPMRPRRHSVVSWSTMIDVHTIPARAISRDDSELRGKSAIKRHTVIKRRV
ncbi:hypothetical protein T484DRAFT_3635443 [Baffinella frigidus]|nr:hypothetical protein T484DRAFT_3635443 [Cryptophyta sp. CCMP2293]